MQYSLHYSTYSKVQYITLLYITLQVQRVHPAAEGQVRGGVGALQGDCLHWGRGGDLQLQDLGSRTLEQSLSLIQS